MPAWFTPIWHYAQLICPFLVTAGIPSIIVGLSKYPQTEGAATKLQMFLNMISMLHFSDSPGTMKMPFTTSPAPEDTLPTGPAMSTVITKVLAFGLCAVSLSACASGVDGARQSLSNIEQVITSSEQAFVQYDKAHQLSIVEHQPPYGNRDQMIAQYRATNQRSILLAFISVHGIVNEAEVILGQVASHQQPMTAFQTVLNTLATAVAHLQTALNAPVISQ